MTAALSLSGSVLDRNSQTSREETRGVHTTRGTLKLGCIPARAQWESRHSGEALGGPSSWGSRTSREVTTETLRALPTKSTGVAWRGVPVLSACGLLTSRSPRSTLIVSDGRVAQPIEIDRA